MLIIIWIFFAFMGAVIVCYKRKPVYEKYSDVSEIEDFIGYLISGLLLGPINLIFVIMEILTDYESKGDKKKYYKLFRK